MQFQEKGRIEIFVVGAFVFFVVHKLIYAAQLHLARAVGGFG